MYILVSCFIIYFIEITFFWLFGQLKVEINSGGFKSIK